MQYPTPIAQHSARPRRALAIVLAIGVLFGVFGVALGLAAKGADAVGEAKPVATEQPADPPRPVVATQLPVPEQAQVAAQSALCSDPAMADALATGNAPAAVAAAGGAEAFRQAMIAGTNTCLTLNDPAQLWFVVNKARPFPDTSWEPGDITKTETYSQNGGGLRAEAAAALDSMVAAAKAEGAGSIALNSGYRSYATQVSTYGNLVAASGQGEADLTSARPGHSEHQTGLAADVVACNPSCGTIENLAGTPQGDWIAANSWRFGFVVRYEADQTHITGYEPEPWHLRYIGVELATAYHEGGFRTLEDFFTVPAAPDYVD